MQLRKKITVVRNVRIHYLSLLNAKHKTQLFQFRGCGQNGKNNTQTTTGKPIQLIFHGIRFISKHLELLEHRATTSAGKQVSILRGIAQKMSPFLPSWQFVQYLSYLDYFLIFALTRHECVTDIIKCFSPILLCFILCIVLIFRSGKPS